MTKAALIEKIEEEIESSPQKVQDHFETLLEIMKSSLESGDDVMISGFGKFQVTEKAPRKGRNPATGGKMILDGRRVVTFRCSGKLRNELNTDNRLKSKGRDKG